MSREGVLCFNLHQLLYENDLKNVNVFQNGLHTNNE